MIEQLKQDISQSKLSVVADLKLVKTKSYRRSNKRNKYYSICVSSNLNAVFP